MANRKEAELIGVLGESGYLILSEACGGQVTYVPKSAKNTELAKLIGEELATLMAQHYGGEHLDLPLSRRFRAKAFYAKGKTIKWIARHLLMTERHVYKVLCELDPVDRKRGQADLFQNFG